ncbi:modulator protein [Defluviimonas sp. 20V17]|uniref:Modulator protein n=1 Tax=Allgaiera indica TaxID=765699 RepID=A0AAN4UNU4_9RHOB|nr:TldD/PmbA family protein [Allgaiera indica]KDB02748.1 modulator protein [Defluviimonas sp. 20V17]GHD98717.1 modulator protein [Allgaiera indica]SDW07732.1 microcin-processing peptidase 1. Unknown type peptidase. MEROPS family U62 [Allgaiera indica]
MSDSLETLAHALLDAARKAGAEAADALVAEGTSVSIDVRGSVLEQAERSEAVELGLRVLIGTRQACVSASDTRAETLSAVAERAVAMAREAPEDATVGLADPSQLATSWDLAALEMADPTDEPDPAELENDARRAESAALAVKGVSQVQGAGAGYGRNRIHLAATNGFSGGYARTSRATHCVAITGEGTKMERDGFGDGRVWQADLMRPEEIGRTAGERAVERAGARKPRTGAYPVLYDERVAASLIGHLLGAVNGNAIARGASWLRDALGESLLPEGLSLIEDPLRPRAGSTRPFDAEGLPATARAIVDRGVLTGWTLDLGTARKLGMESTASASRGTSSPPSPGITNVALTQGKKSRADLIAEMGTGLLVTSMMGSSVNPTTGDYSRGAAGFWVEGGEIAYPVNECTIAGNLRDMLRRIIPANDARLHLSTVVPSLLVEGLTLAGA